MSEGRIVQVTSYAGCKGEERPMAFHDGDQEHRILDIQKRWVENHAQAGRASTWCFRVKTDDGQTYLLRYDAVKDQWCLET